jgi:hypothetical protein
MSEFKGTKGKWEVKKGEVLNGVYSGKEPICICHGGNKVENALLISKAPEMLDMLRVCQQTTSNIHIYAEIAQLIKQATEL